MGVEVDSDAVFTVELEEPLLDAVDDLTLVGVVLDWDEVLPLVAIELG